MKSEFKIGDIIWNGNYYIFLQETPKYNDTLGFFFAMGNRWTPSKKKFEEKKKIYGYKPGTGIKVESERLLNK